MNVKVEKTEKNTVKLEIEVSAEIFETALQKSFLKNAGKFNIPGFRKGKAPRNMVERMYGVESLYEDAINTICPDEYEKAIDDNDIYPVDRPDIDVVQIGKGQNFIFTATVTVKPEVELGQYKGVEVTAQNAMITDEDVENELKKTAETNSRVISVEDRPVQSGDIAVIDFEGFVDEVAFEGGKGENYELTIGSGTFIPGFEDQIIGANIGDEIDVNVSFPEDYGKEDLSGKPALFKVKVNEIKMKELPLIDDEFAKDVSEFDTLEEYKADLRSKLLEKEEHRIEHELEDEILNKVVDSSTIDVPLVMVEKQIDRMLQDLDMRLRYQGMGLEQYIQYSGANINDIRASYKERAEKEVKLQLVVEKISTIEGITASEDEINEEVKNLAERYRQTEEEYRKHLTPEYIEYISENLKFRNTIKMIVDSAVKA